MCAISEHGLSGDGLASTLPKGHNYGIYADNYFTTVPLDVKRLQHGMHQMGTAHLHAKFKDEKTLKQKRTTEMTSDNKEVTPVSSFAGPPLQVALPRQERSRY